MLGSQDIGNSYFEGAKSVTGTGTCANGSPWKFKDVTLNNPTLTAEGELDNCWVTGLVFTSSAGVTADSVRGIRCQSGVAGVATPPITFAAVTKATTAEFRSWFGGGTWTFTSDCVVSIEVIDGGIHTITTGGGDVELRGKPNTVTLTSSGSSASTIHCITGAITIAGTGGTVTITGLHSGITDNSGGNVVITDNSGDVTDIAEILADTSHADYGNAKLVRSTTPANTLDVSATGEAGLDFNNVKDASVAHTLTNITVPTTITVTDRVTADVTYIHGVALTETVDGYLAAAFVKLFDVATPVLVASDVMRGTNSAALAATALSTAVWTGTKAGYIDIAISSRGTGTALDAAGVRSAVGLASANLDTQLNAIPTTPMRGTDSANTTVPDVAGTAAGLHGTTDGLVGALNDLDAAGVRTAVGLASASLDTQLSAIPTTPMRGTDSANTTVPDAAGAAATLHATTDVLVSAIPTTAMRGTDSAAKAGDKMALVDGEDAYHADVQLTRDVDNSRDEYTVIWYKNAIVVTSGITEAKIRVVKRADGTDLIALTEMTEVGSTGTYKYDEATNRVTAGEAVRTEATAKIDGTTRIWPRVLGRDSA